MCMLSARRATRTCARDRRCLRIPFPRVTGTACARVSRADQGCPTRVGALLRIYCAGPTPSPNAYYNPEKHTTLSRTFHSHIHSPALTKFGSSSRDERHVSDSPGPAQYEASNLDAVRARTPSWGVGKSQREGRLLGADLPVRGAARGARLHCLPLRAPSSPAPPQGPGAYSAPSGIGKQALSLRATSASMRFGSSSRADLRAAPVPGPGAYEVRTEEGLCT